MANGDDFDPTDTPQATGFSTMDSLPKWMDYHGISGDDMQKYLQDPQSFVQDRVAAGHPPPPFNHDDAGNPIVGDPSGGNLTRYEQPTALGYTEDNPPPPRPAWPPPRPEDTSTTPSTARPVPPTQVIPPPPWVRDIQRQTYVSPGAGSLDPTSPQFVGPQPEGGPPPPQEKGTVPIPESDPRKAKMEADKDEEDKAKGSDTSKKISDFGKMLQGIKMPERPKLAPPQSQGIRQSHPLTPNALGLLQALGHPGGQIQSALPLLLQRLLGGRF